MGWKPDSMIIDQAEEGRLEATVLAGETETGQALFGLDVQKASGSGRECRRD